MVESCGDDDCCWAAFRTRLGDQFGNGLRRSRYDHEIRCDWQIRDVLDRNNAVNFGVVRIDKVNSTLEASRM
jgi:hypothetical protein